MRAALALAALALSLLAVASEGRQVCVVGAGAGGAAFAHFWRQRSPQDTILVFERGPTVGGRAATVEVEGVQLEAGASVIHSQNLHLVDWARRLGLTVGPEVYASEDGQSSTFGVFDGRSLLFEMGGSLWDKVRLLWRYKSLSLFWMDSMVQKTLTHWMKLYQYLHEGRAYSSMQEMMTAVGLAHMLDTDVRSLLMDRAGVPAEVVDELVTPVHRVNYGQASERLNGLAGMISLCADGDSVWRTREGNHRILEGVLARSGAQLLLNTTVTAVLDPEPGSGTGGAYLLRHTPTPPGARSPGHEGSPSAGGVPVGADAQGLVEETRCDLVVQATPTELGGGLQLPQRVAAQQRHHDYWWTHATFVVGRLDARFFGEERADAPLPGLIMTTEREDTPINCVGRVGTTAAGRPIYKLFSRAPLDEATLDRLFQHRSTERRVPWQAYPRLTPRPHLEPFRQAPGFYSVSAAEPAASALEVMVLAAQNVANLAARDLGLTEPRARRRQPGRANPTATQHDDL